MDKNNETNDKVCGKVVLIRYKGLNLGLKIKNYTKDWALGSYRHDNSNVTTPDGFLKEFYISCGQTNNAVFRSCLDNFIIT